MADTIVAPGIAVERLMRATREVFETMLGWPLAVGAPLAGEALRPRSNVVGTVSFAGSETGLVAVYSTMGTAEAIAEGLLGVPPAAPEEIADAVGEVTNMIAGTFRNYMVSDGASLAISIPAVTLGSDLYTRYVSEVRRTLCPFTLDDREVFVELILTGR
jgi:chemotaxis protein CheX